MGAGLVIGYDVGRGGCKALLADMGGRPLAVSFSPYPINHPFPGWAEQDPEDWWRAVCRCTRELLEESGSEAGEVRGLGFAGQMADTIPLDSAGEPLSPMVLWLDNRAEEQARSIIRRMGGRTVLRRLAGALPTGKDLVSKWLWFKQERPEVFERIRVFLDATGWLVFRATGEMQADRTGAGASGIFDDKRGNWNRLFLRALGIPRQLLPEVSDCVRVAGRLTREAAGEMGLEPGTPVVSGMSDIPAAAVGAGAMGEGEAHVNLGTSSWLVIPVRRPPRLGRYGMAAVPSADPALPIVIGESETAGACLRWFAQNLLEEGEGGGSEPDFALLDQRVEDTEPGAGGLFFCPWMFGERSPVPDTSVRGAFMNLSLEHSREQMLRAVYEGVALNLRWMLEAAASAGLSCSRVRAIGGGARSDPWMQILADVTGREVEAVERPQEAGALGAALTVAVALGSFRGMKEAGGVVRVRRSFMPRAEHASTYGRLFSAFRYAYPVLSPMGSALQPVFHPQGRGNGSASSGPSPVS